MTRLITTHTSKIAMTSGTKHPLIFFGTEDFSLYSLRALIENGFNVVAVVTKPDAPRGRHRTLTAPTVKIYAAEHNIPVWQPTKLKNIINDIKLIKNPAGVLVSYGKIIPQSVINLFTPSIINVHPSLLPKYRGPSPIESAIANRDKTTGVTLMQLTKDMDAGPIYYQTLYNLNQSETRPKLYKTLGQLGATILTTKLPDILNGTLQPTPQDNTNATYCQLLSRNDTDLDLAVLTPDQAEARIRAHLGFPRSRVAIGSHKLIVTKAHTTVNAKTPLDLPCANGAFLSIDELVAPSGKTMSADAFLRGYSI